ncbi:MAG: molybdenum cofactor biosynthesis protein MoaE [Verrucomicrobiota bacterium]
MTIRNVNYDFSISDQPIPVDELSARLSDAAAGALVTFEGRVRDNNLDRAVTRLEYEAAEELAVNEFEKIARENFEQFDIIRVGCVHRIGGLAIGDIAVWAGVIAGHRGPAFEACRYVIDTLKDRLPIWKKEHYPEGDSGWINSA